MIPPERDALCIIFCFALRHFPRNRDLDAEGVALKARAALGMKDAADSLGWVEEKEGGGEGDNFRVAIVWVSLSLSLYQSLYIRLQGIITVGDFCNSIRSRANDHMI